MFRFETVHFLWGLALVPAFVLLYLWLASWRKTAMKRFGDVPLVAKLMPNKSKGKPVLKLLLFSLAYLSLIIGLANPQIGSKLQEVKREGVDLMLLLDVSESMLAEDLTPNRLEKAKRAIFQLVEGVKNDRIGIVVFAGEAYVQLPITTDYAAAKLFLSTITTGSVNMQGTDIGNAIDLAMESFDFENGSSKAIVVITDGENHEPQALEAAATAAEQGVSVHTIGMGSTQGAPIPIYSNRRVIGHRKDKNGSPVVTKLNAEMLEGISDAGNGIYVQASNSETGLDYIFSEIERMEKSEFSVKQYSDYEDQYHYFIAFALLLFVLEFLISEKRTPWISAIFEPNKPTT